MPTLSRLAPCLWFDTNAEPAAQFYTSVFKNSRIVTTTHYGKAGFETHHKPEGSVLTVLFELDGQPFTALNGGPEFTFTEAVSFEINCDSQEEIDYYWETLSAGGDPKAQVCGWLKDKFGLSWQVVPRKMNDYFKETTAASERVMEAMMKMKKLDIAALEKAYAG